jgi:hypothetical protein
MRDKIKGFLVAQGIVKGSSRSGPRGFENGLPVLEEDSGPSSPESHTIYSPLYHASDDEGLYYPAPVTTR